MIRATITLMVLTVISASTNSWGQATATLEQSALIESGASVKKLAGDMKFTEGPVWLPKEKKLVFSDIPNSKLMQWSESDGLSVFREVENTNGNILDLEGRIVSCQHGARNIVRADADGKISVLVDKFEGKRLNSPNDVAVRSDGTLWFTDPPWGIFGKDITPEQPGNWVYKLDPKSGKIEVLIKDMAMPNGINFSPDESRLYVADTGGHPKHQDPKFRKYPSSVRCYEVTPDGKLGKALFQIEEGSDGMAVDEKGNLYTTTGGNVNIFSADLKELKRIKIPEGPANVCFGGEDFKTLFITARTSLYSIRTINAGARSKAK